MVSNDPLFTSDPEKTRSSIDYPKLIRSYKKHILKFQTSNSTRFDEIIQFYDNIIFDAGIKKTLGKDSEKPREKSSGSEIDFKTDSEIDNGEEPAVYIFMFNACLLLDDWYVGHYDPEIHPQMALELARASGESAQVSNDHVVQPLATAASESSLPASQPVRPAQQSLGLGLPQSLRRRVTPIPSIQLIPSLDHNSSLSNETPPSPNPTVPTTPTDQSPAPADLDQLEPPAPSKRGKTSRGSKTSKGKASGSRGGGKQRAKATATATIE